MNSLIGKTGVISNTLDPEWTAFNNFAVSISEVLSLEKDIIRKQKMMGRVLVGDLTDDLVLFRLEAFDYNMFRPHGHLGTVRVPVEYLRKMCPTLPRNIMSQQSFRSKLSQMISSSESNGPAPSLNKMTSRWFGTSVSELANDTEESKEEEEVEVVTTPDHLKEEEELFSKSKKRSRRMSKRSLSDVNSSKMTPSERRKGLVQTDFFSDTPVINTSEKSPQTNSSVRAIGGLQDNGPGIAMLKKSSKNMNQSIGKLSKQDSNLIDVVKVDEDDDGVTKLNVMRSIKSLKLSNVRTAVSTWWKSIRSTKKIDE